MLDDPEWNCSTFCTNFCHFWGRDREILHCNLCNLASFLKFF
jgi:hypothetical protein